MLLPSDVARLVLGYLQEEGLSATSQAFILESSNLKEYAEHTTGDGTIPACVFSVFGKGLTTILNEYVAAKTKESCHEVPAVMTSLWKKLDFTLNQINPAHTSHSMLGHSTPVSYTALHTRLAPGSGTNQQIHDGSRLLNTPRDSPVQIIVSEHRLNPGPMSPGRRKW
uniref:Nuclear protein, ataxia-telangiectasia locus n=1 Tax=Seriola dumerili TaxID=41447 RepID=A0A3B4UBQ4_SERDU